MLRNHDLLSGRRFTDRANAVADGEQHRRHLLTHGWLLL
jgi:hypothetical protein